MWDSIPTRDRLSHLGIVVESIFFVFAINLWSQLITFLQDVLNWLIFGDVGLFGGMYNYLINFPLFRSFLGPIPLLWGEVNARLLMQLSWRYFGVFGIFEIPRFLEWLLLGNPFFLLRSLIERFFGFPIDVAKLSLVGLLGPQPDSSLYFVVMVFSFLASC